MGWWLPNHLPTSCRIGNYFSSKKIAIHSKTTNIPKRTSAGFRKYHHYRNHDLRPSWYFKVVRLQHSRCQNATVGIVHGQTLHRILAILDGLAPVDFHNGNTPKLGTNQEIHQSPEETESSNFPWFSPYILSQPFPRINLKIVHLQFGGLEVVYFS